MMTALPRAGRVSLTLAFLCAAMILASQPAAACSAGPFDRRAHTALFVIGRITSVELRPSTFPPSKHGARYFEKVVTMQVDLVLKGRTASTVTFVDSGVASEQTATNTGERKLHWGGGGDCGAIEQDPRGRYAAFALSRDPDGELRSSILYGVAFGADAHDLAIQRLIESHGLALPSTATEPAGRADPVPIALGGLVVLALPFTAWRAMRKAQSRA